MTHGFPPPPVGPGIEPVRRVHAQLDRAADGGATVCAPAGYGKTSQVALWAARTTRPVVWAALGQADNDPQSFTTRLGLLFESVTSVGVDARARAPALGSHRRMVVPAVTEMLRRIDRPIVVVFDDIHVIDDPTALDTLGAVVDHVPAGSTVVLIGRRDPGVSLGRLWAQDRVRGITPSDLALVAAEARAVFDSMGVDIDETRLQQYVHDTEGWPVGLRLAALASVDEGGSVDGDDHGSTDATSWHARLEELEASLRAARDALPVGPSSLTTAELGVLHFLPTNLSLAEIAQHLHVSRNTAKSHAAAVYRKLGVSSRGVAVTVAREAGLLPR